MNIVETITKIVKFLSSNKKIMFSVMGGIAAAGIIAGTIMFSNGNLLKGEIDLQLQQVFCSPSSNPATTGQTVTWTATRDGYDEAAIANAYKSYYKWSGDTEGVSTGASTLNVVYPKGTESATVTVQFYVRYQYYNADTLLGSASCSVALNDPIAIQKSISPSLILTQQTEQTQQATQQDVLTLQQIPSIPSITTCTYTPSAWTPDPCTSGTQTRSLGTGSPAGCTPPSVLPETSRACPTSIPACQSFTYTPGPCVNGTQTLTVNTRTPSNCVGGVTPLTSQSCTSSPSSGTQTQQNAGQQNYGTEIQEEVPTECTGADILKCSAMSDTLYLSDNVPLRVNCSMEGNGYVTADVVKGAISDPNQPQTESSIVKNILQDKSYNGSKSKPQGFYILFDGLDKYDSPVDEGDYTILTTARETINAAPDCSVQKFKVVKERPQPEEAQEEAAPQETATPAATAAPAEEAAPAEPEAAPEPSKCPGVNYPKDISGHWAENLIKKAYDLCMFKGYEDGTFRPDSNITRAEALKTVLSAAGIPPITGCYDADCGSPFMDLDMWMGPWVRAGWNEKIIVGAEKFRPNDPITRAEAAVMVAKAFIRSGKITTPLRTDCYTPNCGAGFPNSFFTDIGQMWQGPAIRWLWDAGLTQGKSPGKFAPDTPITRAELTKLVMVAAGK